MVTVPPPAMVNIPLLVRYPPVDDPRVKVPILFTVPPPFSVKVNAPVGMVNEALLVEEDVLMVIVPTTVPALDVMVTLIVPPSPMSSELGPEGGSSFVPAVMLFIPVYCNVEFGP